MDVKVIAIFMTFILLAIPVGTITNSYEKMGENFVNAGMSNGKTLYVGGDGPNNYTSIQDAINAASDGDTIFVYDDSSPYYENIVIDKSITLIGENAKTTILDGRNKGYVIQIKAENVTVSKFTITHGGFYGMPEKGGIGIFSDYAKIINNIIVNNGYYGMQIYSNHNLIEENKIHSHIWWGMYFEKSSNNTIKNNTIYDSKGGLYFIYSCHDNRIENNIWRGIEHAIDIFDSCRNIVARNKIFDISDGISISSWDIPSHATHNYIAYNEISDCCRSGIILEGEDNRIEGNSLSECGGGMYGGLSVEARHNLIVNNTFLKSGIIIQSYPNKLLNNSINGKPLIYIENQSNLKLDGNAGQIIAINCDNVEIRNVSISHTNIGIQLFNCKHCSITQSNLSHNGIGIECNGSYNLLLNNTIMKNGDYGIWCDGSFNIIEENRIVLNYIAIYASKDNRIRKNYISHNEIGVEIGSRNVVESNTISFNNLIGVYLASSHDNSIKYNKLMDNGEGIAIDYGCKNNVIAENNFEDDGIWIWWWIIKEMGHNEIYGNKINGKLLVYMEGEKNKIVEKAGQIIAINCENISIKNQNISHVPTGILLWKSKNCNISNNRIRWCEEGIVLVNSHKNFIHGNIISHDREGISIYESSYNAVSENVVKNCSSGIGIESSDKNMLHHNSILQNKWGIWLENANYNELYRNKIEENGNASIVITSNFNKFICNDLQTNERDIILYSFHNLWLHNHWDRWHIPLPKPILGHLGYMPKTPWLNFDWMPSMHPYGGENEGNGCNNCFASASAISCHK